MPLGAACALGRELCSYSCHKLCSALVGIGEYRWGAGSCGFQLSLRRWLEHSKPLAEPRLTELASHERGLNTNAALDVLEDEAVAMRPKHHAKTGAHVVNIVPAPHLPDSKCGTKLLSGPASKALDPVVSFVVRRPLRDFLTIVHSGLKRRESELSFEDTARGEELLVIPRWRVNPKGLRVDLVDGYMNVLVVFVVVTRGDVLVPENPNVSTRSSTTRLSSFPSRLRSSG